MKKISLYIFAVSLSLIIPRSCFAYTDLPNWPVYDMSGRVYNHLIVEADFDLWKLK